MTPVTHLHCGALGHLWWSLALVPLLAFLAHGHQQALHHLPVSLRWLAPHQWLWQLTQPQHGLWANTCRQPLLVQLAKRTGLALAG